ncbi:putative RDD family membrane protein YckC [Nocardioides ginsengisegetis]|uniref:Putative RDD family membrane protein YckC n=1 Tax=Nocardioides ginsengisegetis TaxID=661491 RepID=A0A7W3P834_9ACTN|nr:RDD family protein [Nocardioides ginsengisegetis]MBA8802047.1 putative RDD family membrane protein YckC [Nocardioides ginsengisegetis]
MSTPEFATLTTDDLVTGEAVALDLPPAGLGPRIASGLIDVVVTVLLLVGVVLLLTVAALQTDEALLWVAFVSTMILVFLVFPTTVETVTRGKSLGKWALGLRTVRDDAGPISFQHAFVRALIGVVEIYLFSGAPAFFSALLSGRGKRLGDYAAGTYVVRERVRLRLAPPPLMPPPLAQWAAGADMASLPTGLALAVRQFLSRLPQIDPASRASLGGRLANQVSEYVAPPPPPGTPPEAFLAAVVASRRERDRARLAREADLRARLTARR